MGFEDLLQLVDLMRILSHIGNEGMPGGLFHDLKFTAQRAASRLLRDQPDRQGHVQEPASHADPRTTMTYDRTRASLDRHAAYVAAAYLAGATR